MYWRVKKISPEQVARQYGVYAFLIVSVFFNMLLFSRGNPSHAVSKAQNIELDKFARQVTAHLYDANYLTFGDSMQALLNKELAPNVIAKLKADGTLPDTQINFKAIEREMREKKSVSCVRVESCDVGPPDAKNFVPVEVKMVVVVHDLEGVRPVNLKLKYMMGQATRKGEPAPEPIVVDFGAAAASASPTQEQ